MNRSRPMKKIEYEAAEADWRAFRELRELALERFCERILGEIGKLTEEGGSCRERYGKIYDVIHKRDKQMAATFDGARRSRMREHLLLIFDLGLLTPAEVARFGEVTQVGVKVMEDEPDKE